jgi:hypothetical protein
LYDINDIIVALSAGIYTDLVVLQP